MTETQRGCSAGGGVPQQVHVGAIKSKEGEVNISENNAADGRSCPQNLADVAPAEFAEDMICGFNKSAKDQHMNIEQWS